MSRIQVIIYNNKYIDITEKVNYIWYMVGGYRCYSVMSSLEQRRWQRNVHDTNKLLNANYWTFSDFIIDSFFWNQTREGFQYWDQVADKYILHDLLTPQPRYYGTQALRPLIWP